MKKDEKKVIIKVDGVEFPEFKAVDNIKLDKDKLPIEFNQSSNVREREYRTKAFTINGRESIIRPMKDNK